MKGLLKFVFVVTTALLALYGLYCLLKKYGSRLGLECFEEEDELLCGGESTCLFEKVKTTANKEICKLQKDDESEE